MEKKEKDKEKGRKYGNRRRHKIVIKDAQKDWGEWMEMKEKDKENDKEKGREVRQGREKKRKTKT